MMSMTDNPDVGQQRLHTRRRKLIRLVALATLGFTVLGAATGFIAAMTEGTRLPSWTVMPLVAAAVIGLAIFSVVYFRRIDEVDLADNLWASLIGLYFYGAAFPAWEFLNTIGSLPPVHGWGLWGATMVVALLAYVARRTGLR